MKHFILDRLVLTVPFLVVLIVSGCGTIITLQEDAEFDCRANIVYLGTRRTVANVAHTWPDIPFSLVADTLVLPYTVPKTIWNYYHPRMIDGERLDSGECLEEGYKNGPRPKDQE
jgi:uncharacterized protein YceK